MKIDSHHHFWKYNPVEYDWISDEMKVIRRDFLPSDLRRESNLAGVDGVISVQARQTVEETKWLLKLAAANDFIKGVVGWLPLVSKTLTQDLEQFAAHQKLKGLRHVLQGEPDESYLLNPDFNAGIRAIKPFNLVYDLLFFERQLPAAIQFVDRHPSQLFVLDHIAKPRIKDGLQEPWNKNIRELARRENVYCKISGMVTEADWSAWTEAQLQPYVETVLEAFGAKRVMFGSDWPVCLIASGYSRWLETVERLLAGLSTSEKAHFFSGTASKVYRLNEAVVKDGNFRERPKP
jgi:L-fuconolactonase